MCERFGMAPDPSVLVTLTTEWDKLSLTTAPRPKQSATTAEGEAGLLPLAEVLARNGTVRVVRAGGSGRGGNTNARVLRNVLEQVT